MKYIFFILKILYFEIFLNISFIQVLVAVSKLIALGQDGTSMSSSLIALRNYVNGDKALVVCNTIRGNKKDGGLSILP